MLYTGSVQVHSTTSGLEAIMAGFGNQSNQIHTLARLSWRENYYLLPPEAKYIPIIRNTANGQMSPTYLHQIYNLLSYSILLLGWVENMKLWPTERVLKILSHLKRRFWNRKASWDIVTLTALQMWLFLDVKTTLVCTKSSTLKWKLIELESQTFYINISALQGQL